MVKQALSALSSPKESGNKRHLLQKESAGLGLALMLTIPFLFFLIKTHSFRALEVRDSSWDFGGMGFWRSVISSGTLEVSDFWSFRGP